MGRKMLLRQAKHQGLAEAHPSENRWLS
jgi:hypothetical protein